MVIGFNDYSSEANSNHESIQKAMSLNRILLHGIIQGLAMIISAKHELIYSNDIEIFKNFVKLVFKKGVKSLTYCNPLILEDLLELTERNEYGLGIFNDKLKQIFFKQNEIIKVKQREVYKKVNKYMPYEIPMFLILAKEKFEKFPQMKPDQYAKIE